MCQGFLDHVHRIEKSGPLTALELDVAKNCAHHAIDHSEKKDLLANRKPQLLLVRQLRLFMDKDGLTRYGGRINNASLPKETKFPILSTKERGE